jgi:hypothetical protein
VGRDPLLLLDYPDFSERMGKFLKRLESDSSLQQLFIRDPGSVLSRTVFADESRPSSSVINQGNRLMFALLSNDGFLRWAEGYSERLAEAAQVNFPDLQPDDAALAFAATLERDEIYAELVDAALDNVDRELLAALMVVDVDDVEVVVDPGRRFPGTAELSPVFVVIFVAIAVVIAAVALNHHIARAVPAGFSRDDLSRLSRLLMDGLTQHARELRSEGKLASPASARRGSTI